MTTYVSCLARLLFCDVFLDCWISEIILVGANAIISLSFFKGVTGDKKIWDPNIGDVTTICSRFIVLSSLSECHHGGVQ